ncbi:MAG: GAF domain-containing protein [Comamonadaceae bacterium]|nr:GAF domain-containing protein [Comamonadaceae bacterium]
MSSFCFPTTREPSWCRSLRRKPTPSTRGSRASPSGCSITLKERASGRIALPGAMGLYLPLFTSSRTVGVLGILPGPASMLLDQEQLHILESFANQTAIALEKALLAEETQQAILKAEREALRNTLLSSVSHDLRTPLPQSPGLQPRSCRVM